MQALKLGAGAGWQWVVAGWRLFRAQPFSFIALIFFYWLTVGCASVLIDWLAQGIGTVLPFLPIDRLALFGGLLVAMLTPILTVGFLQACRVAASGLPVHPLLLFAPFRADRRTLLRLLALGGVQVAASLLIVLATSGSDALRPDGPLTKAAAPSATPASPASSTPTSTTAGEIVAPSQPRGTDADATTAGPPTEAELEAMRNAVSQLGKIVFYLPLELVMWYAPMLVAWHGLPAGKALFFSLVAVWRNRMVFVVYGVAWLAVWLSLLVAVALVAKSAGLGNFAVFLAAPVVMLLVTCMYCSVYATYATVFVDPAQPTPPVDLPTTG